MIAASGTHGLASHAYGRAALIAAVVLAGAGCGNEGPDPVTTTSSVATTSTTTTSAPATTTTTSTATTSTTTTSIPALSASYRVEGNPPESPICTAASSGSVNCRFIASASGGTPPYTFNWRFQNPTNGNSATPSGQQVDPTLGCDIATGVRQFELDVRLTATDATRATATVERKQLIQRAAGSCGV